MNLRAIAARGLLIGLLCVMSIWPFLKKKKSKKKEPPYGVGIHHNLAAGASFGTKSTNLETLIATAI